MKWITRERPKIDRIACPWLIRKCVDPEAEFLYVPTDKVLTVAREKEAIPYDIPGVELTHDGPYYSFDAIIKKHKIEDPAVLALAKIVRAADGYAWHCARGRRIAGDHQRSFRQYAGRSRHAEGRNGDL